MCIRDSNFLTAIFLSAGAYCIPQATTPAGLPRPSLYPVDTGYHTCLGLSFNFIKGPRPAQEAQVTQHASECRHDEWCSVDGAGRGPADFRSGAIPAEDFREHRHQQRAGNDGAQAHVDRSNSRQGREWRAHLLIEMESSRSRHGG